MPISAKRGGAYSQIVGMSFKRSGVYQAVVGAYIKTGGVYQSVLAPAPAFSPSNLFADGELGVYYDASDMSSLYQDTAGTTPVTAVGQSVARLNDKSGRGYHAVQATAGNRAVLAQDANGVYYLDCSGGAKYYTIPTINAGTDKATLFFAVQKGSSATRASLFETSTDYARAGGMAVQMPHANAQTKASVYLQGTTNTGYNWNYADGETSVFSVGIDISGADRETEIFPQQNGMTPILQGIGAAYSAGTGNIGNYGYTLGARAGGTLPFTGRIYSFCLRFAVTSVADKKSMTDYMARSVKMDYLLGNPDTSISFTPEQLAGVSLTPSFNREIASTISFSTVAVGTTPAGGGERPTLSLTNNSITHAKVLHIAAGFAGYKFWMVATPYFGVVGTDSQYENPHIFCSNDGYAWIEPPGISNPLDYPEGTAYWSDTHLVLADDGYLYCYYRSVGAALGGVVNYYRKSIDGVNWSGRTFLVSSVDGVSPVILKRQGGSYEYLEAMLNPHRGILKVGMTGPATVADKSTGTEIIFNNTPWAADQGVWHLDAIDAGGLRVALINTGPLASTGGKELWVAYSIDGLHYTVVTSSVGPATGVYRSTMIPVRLANGVLELLVYACQTNGIVAVYHVGLTVT